MGIIHKGRTYIVTQSLVRITDALQLTLSEKKII